MSTSGSPKVLPKSPQASAAPKVAVPDPKQDKSAEFKEREEKLLEEEIILISKNVVPEIDAIKTDLEQRIKPVDLQTYENGYYVELNEEIKKDLKKLEGQGSLNEKKEYVERMKKHLSDMRILQKRILQQYKSDSFKMELRDFFAKSQSKLEMQDYIYKVFRIIFSIIALKIASGNLESDYVVKVIGNDELPPSLAKMVGFAIALDFAMNIVFFIFINLVSQKNKVIEQMFENNKKILFYDYLGTMILFTLMGYFISTTVENKRYFRYREDGSRAIRGFELILIYIIIILHLVPFTVIVNNLLSSSKPEYLLSTVLDRLEKADGYTNKIITIQKRATNAINLATQIKSISYQLRLGIGTHNDGFRKKFMEVGTKKLSKDVGDDIMKELANLQDKRKQINTMKNALDRIHHSSTTKISYPNFVKDLGDLNISFPTSVLKSPPRNIYESFITYGLTKDSGGSTKANNNDIELETVNLSEAINEYKTIVSQASQRKFEDIPDINQLYNVVIQNIDKNDTLQKIEYNNIKGGSYNKISEYLKQNDNRKQSNIQQTTNAIIYDIKQAFKEQQSDIKRDLENKYNEVDDEIKKLEKFIKDRRLNVAARYIKGGANGKNNSIESLTSRIMASEYNKNRADIDDIIKTVEVLITSLYEISREASI